MGSSAHRPQIFPIMRAQFYFGNTELKLYSNALNSVVMDTLVAFVAAAHQFDAHVWRAECAERRTTCCFVAVTSVMRRA